MDTYTHEPSIAAHAPRVNVQPHSLRGEFCCFSCRGSGSLFSTVQVGSECTHTMQSEVHTYLLHQKNFLQWIQYSAVTHKQPTLCTCEFNYNSFHSVIVRQHSSEDLIVRDTGPDSGQSHIYQLRGTSMSSFTKPASEFELVQEVLVWSICQTPGQLLLVL